MNQLVNRVSLVLPERRGRLRLVVQRIADTLLSHLALEHPVQFPGLKPHHAGVLAQAAAAAQEGVHGGILRVAEGAIGGQAHHLVRLDAVPQQAPRADLGAQGALHTGHPGILEHPRHGPVQALEEGMALRDYDESLCGLGNSASGAHHTPHHGPAVDDLIVLHGGAARQGQRLRHCDAQGHLHGLGGAHRTGQRDILLNHRGLMADGRQHIEGRLHIADHHAHIQGDAPLRDHTSGHLVDDHLFVTGGIKCAHPVNPQLGMPG